MMLVMQKRRRMFPSSLVGWLRSLLLDSDDAVMRYDGYVDAKC